MVLSCICLLSDDGVCTACPACAGFIVRNAIHINLLYFYTTLQLTHTHRQFPDFKNCGTWQNGWSDETTANVLAAFAEPHTNKNRRPTPPVAQIMIRSVVVLINLVQNPAVQSPRHRICNPAQYRRSAKFSIFIYALTGLKCIW